MSPENNFPELILNNDGNQPFSSDDVTLVMDKKFECHWECAKSTIFFRDGIRSVDFVLAWDSFTDQSITEAGIKKRKIFEKNLIREGLELEYEPAESNGLNFIKVIIFF